MIAAKGILLVLFVLVSYCQATSVKYANRGGNNDAKDQEDMLPLLLLMSGASMVTPAVYLLGVLSLGVICLFTRKYI